MSLGRLVGKACEGAPRAMEWDPYSVGSGGDEASAC